MEFDASAFGFSEPIVLRRMDDLGRLVQVGQTLREAKSLARHWSKVFEFPVSEEVVWISAVVAGSWEGKSVEEVVRMSRHHGPLLAELIKACNRLNGWEERGVPFGTAGGGTGW